MSAPTYARIVFSGIAYAEGYAEGKAAAASEPILARSAVKIQRRKVREEWSGITLYSHILY